MSNQPTPSQHTPRRVSLQQRAIRVGDLVVVNAARADRHRLQAQFEQGGYHLHATPHFAVCIHHHQATSPFLLHWFVPANLDVALIHLIREELASLPAFASPQQQGACLTGIVGSIFPGQSEQDWLTYGNHTLHLLLTLLNASVTPSRAQHDALGALATLYQRVCELCVGPTILDAGCYQGWLPLVLAARLPFLERVVGVDQDAQALLAGQTLAETHGLAHTQFQQGDLRDAETILALGRFETVICLYVLEHFSEQEMKAVLRHLLQVTQKRLIVAVPSEHEHPHGAHGHLHIFSRASLEELGSWCVAHEQEKARFWCEELIGGLLLIEKREDR